METVRRIVDYFVPADRPYGACWVEIEKAISAATQELWKAGRVPRDRQPSDDMIRILPGDDHIIVRIEFDGSEPPF